METTIFPTGVEYYSIKNLKFVSFPDAMESPVENKKDLFERILFHQEKIRGFGVAKLGVFGSFVRDQATASSDVDFFIHFDPARKSFKNFMRLAEMLESITGRKIELVTPQSLSKYIGPKILKEVEYVSFSA